VPARLQALEQRVTEGAYAAALPLAEQLLHTEQRYRDRVTRLLARATAGLASQALDAGRPEQALQWLDRGLRAVGDDGRLLLLSGRAHRALGDPANARYHFDRAARFEPTLADQVADELRRLTLAEVDGLRAAGQTESALARLTEAAQRYPDDPEYQRALAELQLQRGEVDAAAAAADRAVALGGDRYAFLAFRVRELRRERDDQGVTQIPFEVGDGVMYVVVRINGGAVPLRFVLDTGASHTVIAAHVASALGVRGLPGAAPVGVSTANGRTTALPTVLRSVALGDISADEVPALILEGLHGADGLLGLSFLQRFHLEIRTEAGQVALRPR
jgi:clan AA aspartic protease (TIGR02281 family)